MELHSFLWHIIWLTREELVKRRCYIYVFVTSGFLQGSPNKSPRPSERRRTHRSCGLTSGGSAAPAAAPARTSPRAGQRPRLSPHTPTRPQELVRLKNNLAKPSESNQTFCGQVSILSTAVPLPVRSQARVRQREEGTAAGAGGQGSAQNRPQIVFTSQ